MEHGNLNANWLMEFARGMEVAMLLIWLTLVEFRQILLFVLEI